MVSRMDLMDRGSGSPEGLVGLILKHEPDLKIPVPIEDLCHQLDVQQIAELQTEGFVGGLITDADRSDGAIILVKNDLLEQRRRFTIGHELGHYLLRSHVPDEAGRFLCSREDMLRLELKELAKRERMEYEANQFASLILIPPPALRKVIGHRGSIAQILSLALQFNVSKEAMGRAYVNYHGEALALVVVRDGVVQRFYKNLHFKPTIQNRRGATVEQSSFFHDASHRLHEPSRWSECDPETWLTLDRRNNRLVLSEQVYLQQDGYAMVLLKVEMLNDEDEDEEEAPRPRFGFNRY